MTIQINNLNGNVNIYNYEREPNTLYDVAMQPNDTAKPSNAARTKKLFMTDGAEDLLRTEEECNRFLNYLAEHHLRQRQVDCYKDNPINKAIVCFCVKWKRLKMIDKPSPAAVYRFLTETCHLECAAETDAITASLGRLLKADYDKETFYDVENYF